MNERLKWGAPWDERRKVEMPEISRMFPLRYLFSAVTFGISVSLRRKDLKTRFGWLGAVTKKRTRRLVWWPFRKSLLIVLGSKRAFSIVTKESALRQMRRGNFAFALTLWAAYLELTGGDEEANDADAGRFACEIALGHSGPREPSGTSLAQSINGSPIVYTANIGGHDPAWTHRWLPGQHVTFVDSFSPLPRENLALSMSKYASESPRQIARWHKTHPHALFPSSSLVIWMDSNVVSLAPWEKLIEDFLESERAIGTFRHPQRESVSQEISACIEKRKDSFVNLAHLKKMDLNQVDKVGLWETNVIAFNLRNPATEAILTNWWRAINQISIRDQICLPFVVTDMKCADQIHNFGSGLSSRSMREFAVMPHGVTDFSKALEQRLNA